MLFTVILTNGSQINVEADYIQQDTLTVRFFKSMGIFKFDRCVSVVDWRFVAAVNNYPNRLAKDDFAKELGIKI